VVLLTYGKTIIPRNNELENNQKKFRLQNVLKTLYSFLFKSLPKKDKKYPENPESSERQRERHFLFNNLIPYSIIQLYNLIPFLII